MYMGILFILWKGSDRRQETEDRRQKTVNLDSVISIFFYTVFYFGCGGPGNARVIRLNSDMTSVSGDAVTH